MDVTDAGMYERRSSARIKKLNDDKTLSGCTATKYVEEPEIEMKKNTKRKRTVKLQVSSNVEESEEVKAQSEVTDGVAKLGAGPIIEESGEVKVHPEVIQGVGEVKEAVVAGAEIEGGARSAYAVVRAAIRSFYTYYLHFVQVCFCNL